MHEDMKFSIALEVYSKLLDNYTFHVEHERQPYGVLFLTGWMKEIDSSDWEDIIKIVESKFIDNMKNVEIYNGTNCIGLFKK